jgi:hypothetical protein
MQLQGAELGNLRGTARAIDRRAPGPRLGQARLDGERQSGSHVVLGHSEHGSVTVPVHRGKTLKEGTARGILKAAGVSEEDLFEVY